LTYIAHTYDVRVFFSRARKAPVDHRSHDRTIFCKSSTALPVRTGLGVKPGALGASREGAMMIPVHKYISLGTKRRQLRNTIGVPEAVNPAERTESSELRAPHNR
jgi:hypothetical protein